jgi:hypothetical protein
MTTEESEKQVAALQKRIRRAGWLTRRLRLALLGAAVVLMLVWMAVAAAQPFDSAPRVIAESEDGVVAYAVQAPVWSSPIFIALAVAEVAVLALLVALPAALLYRRTCCVQLRRSLAQLPPPGRGAVLLPLRGEPLGDTRKIVVPLLRQLRIPTEPVPAEAPASRGDEATP